MAKSKLVRANRAIARGVVSCYRAIESGVVNTYQKIQDGVVDGYQKIQDAFVDEFLTRDGETVEDAEQRLAAGHPDPHSRPSRR